MLPLKPHPWLSHAFLFPQGIQTLDFYPSCWSLCTICMSMFYGLLCTLPQVQPFVPSCMSSLMFKATTKLLVVFFHIFDIAMGSPFPNIILGAPILVIGIFCMCCCPKVNLGPFNVFYLLPYYNPTASCLIMGPFSYFGAPNFVGDLSHH